MNIIVLYTNDLNECIVRHMEARYQLVEFYIANVAETYVKEASDIVTMAFPSIENGSRTFEHLVQEARDVATVFKTWVTRVGTVIQQTPQRVFMSSGDNETPEEWILSATVFNDIYITKDHPDYALAYSAASIVINNFVQAWNDPSEPSYVIFNENRVPQFEVGAVEVPCISCKTPAVTKKWKATTTFVELYGHRMINLKPSELIAFINREAPDPKAVDDKLIKTFLASTSHRDINYQTVEYNIFNGWSFEDNGASSVPVAFTVGQFTAYTLSPRQRKATILFLELHGAAILKVQQADVETFVIDQGGSIDDISVILIHQLLATLKYRGSLQGTIDFSTVNFDRYLGWHFDLKRIGSWSNNKQAELFSTTILKLFSTQVLRQIAGHLHPACVLSAVLFNLGYTPGQLKSIVSAMDMVFKDSYLDRSGHRDTFTHLERTRQAMLLINQIRWHLVQGYSSAITSASGVLFYHDVTPEDAIAIVAPVKRKVSSQSCESKRRRLESEQTINDLNVRVDKLKERISVLKIKDMRLSVLKKLVKVTKRLDTLLG